MKLHLWLLMSAPRSETPSYVYVSCLIKFSKLHFWLRWTLWPHKMKPNRCHQTRFLGSKCFCYRDSLQRSPRPSTWLSGAASRREGKGKGKRNRQGGGESKGRKRDCPSPNKRAGSASEGELAPSLVGGLMLLHSRMLLLSPEIAACRHFDVHCDFGFKNINFNTCFYSASLTPSPLYIALLYECWCGYDYIIKQYTSYIKLQLFYCILICGISYCVLNFVPCYKYTVQLDGSGTIHSL